MLAKDLTDTEYFYGHKACPGCALGIVCRLALKVCGPKTMLVLPASCASSVTAVYPQMSVLTPQMTGSFPATGALLTGLAAGFQAIGEEGVTVLGIAGDGGTTDIGLQSLSGAIEQGKNFLYICYDNEAYMNTGVQRSSATPTGAVTTTTPVVPKEQPKKDFIRIMEAHHPKYLATASSSYPGDLYNKFLRAKEIRGTRFIYLAIPCPPGWGFPTKDTVTVGRLAVESGIVILFEVDEGVYKLTGKSLSMARSGRKRPVDEYLKIQGRFRRMAPEDVTNFQRQVDEQWERSLKKAGL